MNGSLLTNIKVFAFYDADENNYYGRVVAVEWKPRERSMAVHYQLVTIALNEADEADPDNCFEYLINEVLHDLIKACPNDRNCAFNLSPSKT